MNVIFEYLYRDAGNFKNWGEVIFSNRNNLDVYYLEKDIRKSILDGEFFNASKVNLPNLRFQNYIDKLDLEWNEFYEISSSNEKPNDKYERDIREFVTALCVR